MPASISPSATSWARRRRCELDGKAGLSSGVCSNSGEIRVSSPLPPDLIKYAPQPLPAQGIDLLKPGDATFKVGTEIAQARTILRLGPVLAAIVQDRFQLIVRRSWHVDMIVDHDPSDTLASAAPHDACLSAVQEKSLVVSDAFHALRQERSATNPCAQSCTGAASSMAWRMRRWIAMSLGLGASINRGGPLRLGTNE